MSGTVWSCLHHSDSTLTAMIQMSAVALLPNYDGFCECCVALGRLNSLLASSRALPVTIPDSWPSTSTFFNEASRCPARPQQLPNPATQLKLDSAETATPNNFPASTPRQPQLHERTGSANYASFHKPIRQPYLEEQGRPTTHFMLQTSTTGTHHRGYRFLLLCVLVLGASAEPVYAVCPFGS